MLGELLQIRISPADSLSLGGMGKSGLSVREIALAGGPFLILILVLFVFTVYIFLQRFSALSKASRLDINFMNRIRDYIHDGKVEAAHALCRSISNPAAKMIDKGIGWIGRPMNDVSNAIHNVIRMEIHRMEKGIVFLAIFATASILIGLAGTVYTLIGTFHAAADEGFVTITPQLSTGIYKSLIATEAGLTSGLLTYLAYRFLTVKLNKFSHSLHEIASDFMDLLNEPSK